MYTQRITDPIKPMTLPSAVIKVPYVPLHEKYKHPVILRHNDELPTYVMNIIQAIILCKSCLDIMLFDPRHVVIIICVRWMLLKGSRSRRFSVGLHWYALH